MKRATRHRLILVGTVVTLVAVVLWLGARDQREAPLTLTDLDPASITRIELTIAQQPVQIFEKSGGHWWRIAPTRMRGNDEHLQRLAKLALSPVARWAKADAFDPAKVGLAQPAATLVLDGVQLRYGALSALDNLRYVGVGDRVALVPQQDSPEITLAMKPAKD
ncbi:MAG TPA: hypothetical protein VFH52_07770 [Rhodanobacteraceae bacterium]|nr:hypothetical protein [Rhodanobacteraceae bacterium]